jgi:hypothetical protein
MRHAIDPLLLFINSCEESNIDDKDFNVFVPVDSWSYSLSLGFLNDIIKWDVDAYRQFLEDIKNDIKTKYDFVVGNNEPCTWLYNDGYLFYSVWDCGAWFNSYKTKLDIKLLLKLEAIQTKIKVNIDDNH